MWENLIKEIETVKKPLRNYLKAFFMIILIQLTENHI